MATKEDFKVVRYTGRTFYVNSKQKRIKIEHGEAIGYKKPSTLYQFLVGDMQTFPLNARDAERILSLCEPIQPGDKGDSNIADFRKNVRLFAQTQIRQMAPQFERRWKQDRKNWHWQQFNNFTYWFNMPLTVVDQDEFRVTARIILMNSKLYLLILFPAQVRNARYRVQLPMFQDLVQVFEALVQRMNQRFKTNASVDTQFKFMLNPDLRRATLEQNVLPAWICTDDFMEGA